MKLNETTKGVGVKIILLSIVFIMCAVSVVFSQEAQPKKHGSSQTFSEPEYEIGPIIVTATRSEHLIFLMPYAVDVIGQGEIQRAEVGISLDEALRATPGVVVNNRYDLSTGERISIRGIGARAPFGIRGIKIILDGIPLTMPDGTSFIDNLNLGSAGKIEVLRGPSSSLYGNASGGLIKIQTQSAPSVPFLFQPQFILGDNGLRKWQGKFSGKAGKHSYILNLNKLQLDGFREHSAASSTSVNAVWRRDISDNLRLTAVFNYFDSPYLLNPSSLSKTDAKASPTMARFFVKQQGAGKQLRRGQGGITLKYGNNRTNELEATLYGLSRSGFTAIPGRAFEPDQSSAGMHAVFSRRFHIGNLNVRWTAGTDIESQSGTQIEYENSGLPEDQVETADEGDIFDILQYGPRTLDQDEKVFVLGPFTELEFSPGSKWLLTFGQRYDRYRFEATDHFMEDGSDDSGTRNMDRFSPMVGVVYHPYDFVRFYSNYSSAFQTPTTIELSNRPTGEGGFNPTLNPEEMRSYELGIKGLWPERRFGYDLSLYILDISDMLISFQIQEPGREESFYRNAGKAQNKGAEVKLDWLPTKGLRTSFAYTFMDFVFKDFMVEAKSGETTKLVQLAGNDVPGISPHRIFAGISYEHAIGAYSEVNLQWSDQYFANDFNGPPPGSDKPIQDFVNDAYIVIDVRLGFQRRFSRFGTEFFLGLNNLLDKRYNSAIIPNAFWDQFFQPAPGRSWYTGVNVSF